MDTTGFDRVLHVALSVPSELLDEQGSKDIVRFFEELFGWQDHPLLTRAGKSLVMGADAYEPLLFLHASKEPTQTAKHDHFAFGVKTMEQLQSAMNRAKQFAESDERATVNDIRMQDYKVAKLHSFFVRFLIPLKIEVQFLEIMEG